MKETFLSIIIPAYNEERRIIPTLEKINQYLREQEYEAEIIVVDDGSTDRTKETVQMMAPSIKNLQVIANGQNRGKGFSARNKGNLVAL